MDKKLFTYVQHSDYQVMRRKTGYGWYRCNGCGTPAVEDNSGQECSRCENWGGCGGDCRRVGVMCEKCGTSQKV